MKLCTGGVSSSLLYLSSLLLVLVYLRIERCIGFILIRTPHSRYKNTIVVGACVSHRQKQSKRSIFSSSNNRLQQHDNNLVVLNGYAQVNDYFSSFNNNNNNDDNENDDSSEEISSGHDHDIGQPSSNKVQDDDEQTRRRISMTYEEIVAYNNARLCPKLLLTQCAIQSFIHLLEECRDPHSGKVSVRYKICQMCFMC